MNSLLNIRVPLVATCFCLLCAGALTSTRAADEKPKVATTHYVDNPKHFAIDVPLTWERKFPENEDERIRFIFATGGKAAANAQPPEFLVVTTGPEAKDDLKSLAAFAAAVRKQITADDKNAKFDKDKELKLDGEPRACLQWHQDCQGRRRQGRLSGCDPRRHRVLRLVRLRPGNVRR